MKITKIDTVINQQPRVKQRTLSISQQKSKGLINKRKSNHLIAINNISSNMNLNNQLNNINTKPLKLFSLSINQNNINNINCLRQNKINGMINYETNQINQDNNNYLNINGIQYSFNSSNKQSALTSPSNNEYQQRKYMQAHLSNFNNGYLNKNQYSQTNSNQQLIIQYIQNQLKMQALQNNNGLVSNKINNKNRIKLPYINKSNSQYENQQTVQTNLGMYNKQQRTIIQQYLNLNINQYANNKQQYISMINNNNLNKLSQTQQAREINEMQQGRNNNVLSNSVSANNNIKQTLNSNIQVVNNGTFINIKSVIPKQKASSNKRKDHSLRDLRILKKQKESEIVDHVMEQIASNITEGNTNGHSINLRIKTNNNSNMKRHNTYNLTSGNNHSNSSPLRLTSDKKRSNHNTTNLEGSQKQINIIKQKYLFNNPGNRQRKSYSIKQQNSRKKFCINYMDFCLFISTLNKIKVINTSVVSYKAFVGKGNNSILIKNCIKNRFWWNIVSQKNQNDVNFLWQQSRCPIFLASLSSSNQIVDPQEFQNMSIKSLKSQKQKQTPQIKKSKYYLQSKNQQKQKNLINKEQTNTNNITNNNDIIRQNTYSGFLRLLSPKQSKQNNATPFYIQLPQAQLFKQSMTIDSNKTRVHNHLQFNAHLTNKKALFYNLKTYYQLINDDPFKYIPLTFHVKQYGDQSWNQFKQIYQEKMNMQNVLKNDFNKKKKKEKLTNPLWIIKPGENTNRGCGIQVSDSLEQIAQMVRTKTATGKNKSSIIQRYLMPFLYNKRKFDIRCYMVATSIKGNIKGYWYQQGYIRTSCKQFTTKNLKNRMIHLTNDAVQKKSQDYGKYQNGNKLSFADFQRYLDNNYTDKKYNFYKQCYPQMMKLTKDALNATYQVLDSNNKQFTFQIFGLDFMIDQDFNTWLIQVNNNPCLQLSSPLLARIIPNMIQNAFKIALDPIFPPPIIIPKTKSLLTDLFQSNKFTLIFNSSDVQQKVQHFMSQNKINLSKIIQGQQQQDQLDDQDAETCQNNGINMHQNINNINNKQTI